MRRRYEAEDAQWLTINDLDGNSVGRVFMSLEAMPVAIADKLPAGFGRSEPNMNPVMPAPVGRLHFSWNPCYMLEELVGGALCRKLVWYGCCCCGVLLGLAAAILAGVLQQFQVFAAINAFFASIAIVLAPFPWVMPVVYVLFALLVLYGYYKCRQSCGCCRSRKKSKKKRT